MAKFASVTKYDDALEIPVADRGDVWEALYCIRVLCLRISDCLETERATGGLRRDDPEFADLRMVERLMADDCWGIASQATDIMHRLKRRQGDD